MFVLAYDTFAGYLHGFGSKYDAAAILVTNPEGTCLLRLSDSQLGAVTIGLYGKNPQNYESKSSVQLYYSLE